MKTYTCIVVDDESPAIRLLENYIAKVAFLELTGTTTSSLEALNMVGNLQVDLMFLDIQMPDLTGIQLSKILKGSTKIIFTTAYPQFALESYELNAIDYLLKPFEFERFYEAVLKLRDVPKNERDSTPIGEYLFIKTDGKNNFEKVYLKDILYIESLKNYVAIHLNGKQIITYNTLKHIEAYLPSAEFVKIHRSYIVSLRHIDKTDSLSVYINEACLPIGDTYRSTFFKTITRRKL